MNDIIIWTVRILFWVTFILLLGLVSRVSKAAEITILEPKQVSLIGEYYDAHRDPYIPEEKNWTYGAGLGTKVTLAGNPAQNWRLFFDPVLFFKASSEQVRSGQLNYELGGEFLGERGIRLYRRHESIHAMEYGRGSRAYPLTDSWKVELIWRLP